MKQAEIRKNGYKALIDSLGVVGMLRFLQQLEIGSGDYTLERQQSSELILDEFRQFHSPNDWIFNWDSHYFRILLGFPQKAIADREQTVCQ
jgi:hypothetical protein